MFKIHKSGVKFWISEGSSLKIHLNRVALPSMQRESVLMKNVNTIGSLSDIRKVQGCDLIAWTLNSKRLLGITCKKQQEELRKECHVTNQKVNLSWELLKHEQAWTSCSLRQKIKTGRLKNEEKVVTVWYEEEKIWEWSETDLLECMVSKSAPRNSSYSLRGNSPNTWSMLCAHQNKV